MNVEFQLRTLEADVPGKIIVQGSGQGDAGSTHSVDESIHA